VLHVASHLWPKEVSTQHILSFLHSKMSHQTTSMPSLQKQNANGTSQNIKHISMVQKTIMQQIFIPCSPFSTILISILEVKISSI
jgi:hypothetical protein